MKKKLKYIVVLIVSICINVLFGTVDVSGGIQASGQAAIVLDVSSGTILYEKNIYEKLPMASTTKIMTALLAIENADLDKIVTVHPSAQGIEGSSIYLEANEKIKMKDLVYGLMLRSGNDAAIAIACEIGGSVEEFVDLMNTRASEIGANNTNFVNPNGLYDVNHYTTAYDLGLITKEALSNPTFREIVSTKMWVAERSSSYKYFSNKNKILSQYDGGDGVKTGFTKKSGRCLVASATREGMQLIAVTLNDGNWFNTTMELFDYCFDLYKPYTHFTKGEKIHNISIVDGKKEATYSVTKKELIVPVSESDSDIISVVKAPNIIDAPVTKGTKIGLLQTYKNGKLLDSTELIIEESIEKLTFKEKVMRFLF
ncbi:D-alanyl-D-alanine carboxypeptidase family protein [Serpentinicella sp. ANB-PHB4]|uniref:D-alanyl-D-alanine carboxypeptidase family protein n=1 Tax=Serpentinicella sp. ANB-PHB4 TaxID=3074076 RepID=UPI00285E8806|nr:D-alanyl-D-alanine carboxypeptidase family protein [Serpentinicella sp. ANB-PHB4]MDR5658157.1 D-alanyl-D-alanine carboxypeptidase family protein [Serpentinicella sp. ANB-PHB4]